jgi:hypothetical protein
MLRCFCQRLNLRVLQSFPKVAFEALFKLESPVLPAAAYNISAMGVFTFNSEGRICA